MVGTYGYVREGTTVTINTESGPALGLFQGNAIFPTTIYTDLQIDIQEISGGGGRTTFAILVSGASKTS